MGASAWKNEREAVKSYQRRLRVQRIIDTFGEYPRNDALKGLANLQTLNLNYTGVTDIDALKGLTELQSLDLSYDNVSNIDGLKGLTNLRTLDLSYTNVSNIDGLNQLADSLSRQSSTFASVRFRRCRPICQRLR
jgi:Leucine-rich repeat (LRR) protein